MEQSTSCFAITTNWLLWYRCRYIAYEYLYVYMCVHDSVNIYLYYCASLFNRDYCKGFIRTKGMERAMVCHCLGHFDITFVDRRISCYLCTLYRECIYTITLVSMYVCVYTFIQSLTVIYLSQCQNLSTIKR